MSNFKKIFKVLFLKKIMDKGVKVILIVSASLLVLVLAVIGFVTTGNIVSSGAEDLEENCREEQVHYEEQEEYLKTEYYTETVPYSDEDCEIEELSSRSSDTVRDVVCIDSHEECQESHTNFWGNEVCDRMETICDEYREDGSVEIENLDDEAGYWYYEWRRLCRSNQPLCTREDYEVVYSSVSYIEPTEIETITSSITYDANGQEYLLFLITDTPIKTNCKTITKYKDVERERQVTAYRPVTKYRTETICD